MSSLLAAANHLTSAVAVEEFVHVHAGSIQAPIIMMSQNRQDAKDRARSELDYRVNLKAELEIAELLQRVSRVEQRQADRLLGH